MWLKLNQGFVQYDYYTFIAQFYFSKKFKNDPPNVCIFIEKYPQITRAPDLLTKAYHLRQGLLQDVYFYYLRSIDGKQVGRAPYRDSRDDLRAFRRTYHSLLSGQCVQTSTSLLRETAPYATTESYRELFYGS